MSIFGFEFRKKKAVSPISGTGFTDEDREQSAKIRKARAETKRVLEEIELERAKADLELTRRELRDMLTEDEEEEPSGSMEDKIMLSLLSMAQMKQKQQQTPTEQPIPTQEYQSMTDEELTNFIKTFSKSQRVMAKALPDNILKDKILEMLPITEETADRGIKILRSM